MVVVVGVMQSWGDLLFSFPDVNLQSVSAKILLL